MLLNFVFATGIGASYVFLSEAFPAVSAVERAGLVYSLGVTIFGGTTQFVVAWLIDRTKDPDGAGLVPDIAANVAAIVAILMLAPRKDTARDPRAALAVEAAR